MSPTAEAYQPNFISECFFLTAVALHQSLIRLFSLYGQIVRDIRELRTAVDQLNASRGSWTVRPQPHPTTTLFGEMGWADMISRLPCVSSPSLSLSRHLPHSLSLSLSLSCGTW
jgi:hypothetical protein